MATREVSNGTRTIERWTNEGAPGYYGGNPLTKQRDLTAAEASELAAMDTANAQGTNRTTIEQQAANALAGNRTFLALASPTNAQNAAQVKALTQQNNRIIRLLLNQLDGTD